MAKAAYEPTAQDYQEIYRRFPRHRTIRTAAKTRQATELFQALWQLRHLALPYALLQAQLTKLQQVQAEPDNRVERSLDELAAATALIRLVTDLPEPGQPIDEAYAERLQDNLPVAGNVQTDIRLRNRYRIEKHLRAAISTSVHFNHLQQCLRDCHARWPDDPQLEACMDSVSLAKRAGHSIEILRGDRS